MAMIEAEPGMGRLAQRAGVERIHARELDVSRSVSQPDVEESGGRRPETPVASRAARQRVVACSRPRRRREWARLLLVGFFACLVVVLVGLFGLPATGSSVPSGTVIVQVAAGDTLWSLAHRFAPHDDPRAIVRRIVELNSLDGVTLRVGQPLAVPADAW
jgi:hypothetical protein